MRSHASQSTDYKHKKNESKSRKKTTAFLTLTQEHIIQCIGK